MLEYEQLVNLILSFKRLLALGKKNAWLCVSSFTFDICELEIWGPLVSGIKVIVATEEEQASPLSLVSLMKEHSVDVMQATPATWALLISSQRWDYSIDTILAGGEALPVPIAKELVKMSSTVYNVYGPTETCIWSTYYHVTDPSTIFIGKPIDNTQVYILERDTKTFTECRRGEIGELWIGGSGLARGYIKRPDLTEKAFVAGTPLGRIYKTGDLARWNESNELEYHGRIDFQVKLRGFRIELG